VLFAEYKIEGKRKGENPEVNILLRLFCVGEHAINKDGVPCQNSMQKEKIVSDYISNI